MKNKIMNKISLLIFIIGLIFIFSPNNVFAVENLNELNFDIKVTESGDMIITEKWNIDFSDISTLFKTFKKDGSYYEITDVSVAEIKENGNKKVFNQLNSYNYHVDEDCFQALVNNDNLFEIAWGVGKKSSTGREFLITYTVKSHVTKYNDCAEIYWKLIGEDFEIPVQKITGVVEIPKGITNIEDLKVWAHGPLNGSINRDSVEKVSFSVEDLSSNDFLEIRIATPTQIFGDTVKISNVNRLDNIISQETEWADEANRKREEYAKRDKMIENVTLIIGGFVSILLLYKSYKNYKKLKQTAKLEPEQKLDYFRDFPDENASAAEAGFLYYFTKGGINYQISKVISGTMLNLALKGWISFEQELNDKKKVSVILNENGKQNLTEDEEKVYEFLSKIPKNDNKFSMKEFQKYCNNNASKCQSLINKIPDIVEKESIKKELFDKELRKEYNKISTAAAGYIGLVIIMIFVAFINVKISLLIVLLSIINSIILTQISKRINGLTQKGVNEKEKWTALKKYMEDFSMLNEREVPDLILWEKYLVFATVFGIADKVIKQLKVRYPELNDEEYMRHHYTYMYIACNNNNFNFIDSMNSSIGSVTNYSSGSGSGGGFSSGGGFGRRRRWRWRPLISK